MLQEAAGGAALKEVVRRHGISEQTYYRWKEQCGGLQVDNAKRLKGLEDENRRLRRIVADQMLNPSVLKDALGNDCCRPDSGGHPHPHLEAETTPDWHDQVRELGALAGSW